MWRCHHCCWNFFFVISWEWFVIMTSNIAVSIFTGRRSNQQKITLWILPLNVPWIYLPFNEINLLKLLQIILWFQHVIQDMILYNLVGFLIAIAQQKFLIEGTWVLEAYNFSFNSGLPQLSKWYAFSCFYPVGTGRKLNVYKTFRRRPRRLLNGLWVFNLRPRCTGSWHWSKSIVMMKELVCRKG